MDAHTYSHDHVHDHTHRKPLKYAIVFTAVIFMAEVIGGLISGSLSLLSDAAHMLQDTFALIISLGAMIVAGRMPTPTKTFGYHRVEIAAAVVNALLLIGMSSLIIFKAIDRFSHPLPIDCTTMLVVAIIGLAANLASAYYLHGSHDLNVRSAFLHVLGDTLSSVAVIVAAIWIAFTGQTFVDPFLGIMIAIMILVSSFSILCDAFRILLEFAPKDVAVADVIAAMESVPGVSGVHNVHIWTLCSNINVLDAHIYCCGIDPEAQASIKAAIRHQLDSFRVKHATLEFEYRECSDTRVLQELTD